MNYLAQIQIMPHTELLDPQGKAVGGSLKKMGFEAIRNVRIGKNISLAIDAPNETEAAKIADDACKKLLVNQIMEQYIIKIEAVGG